MGEILIVRGGPRLGVLDLDVIGANVPRVRKVEVYKAHDGPDDEAVETTAIGTPGQTPKQLEQALRQDLGALG